ncbi:MAG: helix-turn-helix domain-containing protein, partial [Desulfobacteraceae bacterium]
MDDLGKRIRAQRLKRSLTLKQLSEMTGLSIGFLSEIERGISEPSMASLRKIREALGVSLLSFRDSEDERQNNSHLLRILADPSQDPGRYIQDARVVRAGQRKKLAYPGRPGFYELLTPD